MFTKFTFIVFSFINLSFITLELWVLPHTSEYLISQYNEMQIELPHLTIIAFKLSNITILSIILSFMFIPNIVLPLILKSNNKSTYLLIMTNIFFIFNLFFVSLFFYSVYLPFASMTPCL